MDDLLSFDPAAVGLPISFGSTRRPIAASDEIRGGDSFKGPRCRKAGKRVRKKKKQRAPRVPGPLDPSSQPAYSEAVSLSKIYVAKDVLAFYEEPLVPLYGVYSLAQKDAMHMRFDDDGVPLRVCAVDDMVSEDVGSKKMAEDDGAREGSRSVVLGEQGCLPDESSKDVDIQKYWQKRHRLFYLYDQGIQIDQEGWYSVTPEAIAFHTAARCNVPVIIDAFCGVGGNAIQFALQSHRVIAIDIDENRLRMARNNARIYHVEDRIEFIQADFMQISETALKGRADAVYLSPPWGGPSYIQAHVFDLKTMIPMNGFEIFAKAKRISANIVYFLPKNTDLRQISEMVGGEEIFEVEENYLDNKMKAISVYFGDLINDGHKAK